MKNYIKYISLGAAALLLNSLSVQAGIRERLDAANVAFKSLDGTSDNWKKVAQDFINIFDEFNGNIIAVADANGGKPARNSLIDTTWWKGDRLKTYDGHYREAFLKADVIASILEKIGKSLYKKDDKLDEYFSKKVEKPLKKAITGFLGVKKLSQAGAYWEENFVKPVGQLLIDHSQEMNNDAEMLQLLLNLYRCYRGCETIPSQVPSWSNFKKVNSEFYDALAYAVLKCEDSGEKRNILYGILTKEDTLKIQGKDYLGYCEYNLQIDVLSDEIEIKMYGDSLSLPEAIKFAISRAKEIAKAIKQEKQAEEQGEALWRGAGY